MTSIILFMLVLWAIDKDHNLVAGLLLICSVTSCGRAP